MVYYNVLGYAVDPSIDSAASKVPKVVGSAPQQGDIKTVFETIAKRPKDKRKRERNDCPDDIEGFLGPWGGFVDEQKVAKPNEVSISLLSSITCKNLILT